MAAATVSIFAREKKAGSTSRSTASTWVTHHAAEDDKPAKEVRNGTRVTIELEARYQRGRGSVDEYLAETAIANPHVRLHYVDPDGKTEDLSAFCNRIARRTERDQASSLRCRTGAFDDHAQGLAGIDFGSVSDEFLFSALARPWPGGSARVQS